MDFLKGKLIQSLVDHFGPDARRIDHALSVLDHAEALLAETPEADPDTVRAAAVMHDYGIREAEKLHGRCDGPLQEKYGPPLVRKALQRIGMDPAKTRAVCAIVARHHSPPKNPDVNYRILYESDWLVNIWELPALLENFEHTESFIAKNFATPAGIRHARMLLLKDNSIFVRMGNVYQLMIDEEKRRALESPVLLELAEEARRAGVPRAKSKSATPILDLACGTGFHARLLAEAGYSITAIDFSRPMLAEANRLTNTKAVSYRWGNLLEPFPLERKASLALLLGNTLSVFRTERELQTVLRNAADALHPGGILLCQILNYARHPIASGNAVTRSGEASGRPTILTKSLNRVSQKEMLLTFTASQQNSDATWQTQSESTPLRCWTPHNIQKAARKAGLTPKAFWGSLAKAPYHPMESPDCVFLFTKEP